MAQESSLIKSGRNLKRIFLYFVIFVAVYYSWGGIVSLLSKIQDTPIDIDYTPYKESDDKFGKIALPTLEPELPISNNSNPTFTISGGFPNFPDKMTVYKVTKPTETFLTVTRANQSANMMGFQDTTSKPDDNILKWSDSYRYLEMDKDGLKWKLSAQPEFLDFLQTKSIKNQAFVEALNEVSSGVKALDLPNTDELVFTDPKYYKIKLDESTPLGFSTVEEEIDSDLILIINERMLNHLPLKTSSKAEEDIIKKKISKTTKLYGFNPYIGQLYTIFNIKYIQPDAIISLVYNPIKVGEQGIYKVISPFEAFTKLQEGDGYLRAIKSSTEKIFEEHEVLEIAEFNIDATRTELAYFTEDTVLESSYTYPIFVFRGNATLSNGEIAEFVFYVDALDFN
jgi:hypothetical protein